jgi:hypothetical protein
MVNGALITAIAIRDMEHKPPILVSVPEGNFVTFVNGSVGPLGRLASTVSFAYTASTHWLSISEPQG